MSDGVVKGYTKVEDAFVDRYLTRDDESVADAKQRLKAEQAEREEKSAARKAVHVETVNERKTQQAARHTKGGGR